MKKKNKTLISLLLLILISGCGPSLQQVRSMPPQIKYLQKDPFCVYSKLQGNAITKQTCQLCAKLIWNYNWDPSSLKGEIFPLVVGYGHFPFIFNIYDNGDSTVIEMRIGNHHLMRYREIAEDLWNNTDYSACNKK